MVCFQDCAPLLEASPGDVDFGIAGSQDCLQLMRWKSARDWCPVATRERIGRELQLFWHEIGAISHRPLEHDLYRHVAAMPCRYSPRLPRRRSLSIKPRDIATYGLCRQCRNLSDFAVFSSETGKCTKRFPVPFPGRRGGTGE